MIHVTSERMTPVAAIEGQTTSPSSSEVARTRLLKKYALKSAASAAVMMGAIVLVNRVATETPEIPAI